MEVLASVHSVLFSRCHFPQSCRYIMQAQFLLSFPKLYLLLTYCRPETSHSMLADEIIGYNYECVGLNPYR